MARPGYVCLLISGLSDTHLPILILPLSPKPFLPLVLQRRIAHSISSLDGHSVYKVHRASVTSPHRPAMTVDLCRMVKRVEMRLNLRRIKLRIPSPDRALLARAGGLIKTTFGCAEMQRSCPEKHRYSAGSVSTSLPLPPKTSGCPSSSKCGRRYAGHALLRQLRH